MKVLLTLAVAGWAGVAETLERQVQLGGLLRERLVADGYQIENDTVLPVVCFRRPARTDGHHRAVAAAVCASGAAWLTAPRYRGHSVLRAAVVHHRTGEADVDALLAALAAAESV